MFSYLSFISKKAVDERSSDEGSERAESEPDGDDAPFDVFDSPVGFQRWGEGVVASYHFVSVRDVAPHLSSWCFNRKIDDSHKKAIKDALTSTENPHVMGAIQIVRDRKLNVRIVNGQHRIRAIQEILEEDVDMKFQMQIMFEVYDVDVEDIDDIGESHAIIETIFKIANNALNVAPEQDHEIFCKRLAVAMMSDATLNKGIVDKTNGEVRKPRISAKMLFEYMKSFLRPESIDAGVDEIVARIKKINAQISTTPFVKLFGRHTPAQYKLRQFEKAKELGFYLNLSGKMSPDVWIETL